MTAPDLAGVTTPDPDPEEVWQTAINGTDAEWFALMGLCGYCGQDCGCGGCGPSCKTCPELRGVAP